MTIIDGVTITGLSIFHDERGAVMHMLRCDDPLFTKFGEVYFSLINPKIIKAWKKHTRMTQLFAVPSGNIKLVIMDDRETSSTNGQIQEILLGEKAYHLVRIPPGLWYGFSCLGKVPALVANCTDIPHDPKETEHLEMAQPPFQYEWVSP